MRPRRCRALPAAVGGARLRIATEALTNAVRHCRANSCRVTLDLDPSLAEVRLQEADDGCGVSAGHRSGVGLASMAECAAELGGQCEIFDVAGGGTQVSVRLPIARDFA